VGRSTAAQRAAALPCKKLFETSDFAIVLLPLAVKKNNLKEQAL
jgi:hypothetical protein